MCPFITVCPSCGPFALCFYFHDSFSQKGQFIPSSSNYICVPGEQKKSLYLQCKGLGSIFCKQGIFSSFFPDYSLNMLQLHRTILLYLMFLLDVNFQFEGYNQSSFIKYLVASVHICIVVDFIFGVSTHAFSAKMCCSFLGHLSFFFCV